MENLQNFGINFKGIYKYLKNPDTYRDNISDMMHGILSNGTPDLQIRLIDKIFGICSIDYSEDKERKKYLNKILPMLGGIMHCIFKAEVNREVQIEFLLINYCI